MTTLTSTKLVDKATFNEFKRTYEKDKILIELEKDADKLKLEKTIEDINRNFQDLSNELKQTNQVIEYVCVQRLSIDPSETKSIIYLGDIIITSKKKFSSFSKWLWKKLFGWNIQDYQK